MSLTNNFTQFLQRKTQSPQEHHKWILGSWGADLALLSSPGALLGFWMRSSASPTHGTALAVAVTVTAGLFDAGHVYTTAWRVWLRRPAIYPWLWRVGTPLFCWILLGTLAFVGGHFFWTVLVYLTMYHHVRQYQGVLHWYGNLNRRRCSATNAFAIFFMLLCLLGFHVKPGARPGFFTPHDIILFPNPRLYEGCRTFFWWGLGCYVIFELWMFFAKRLWEPNRIGAMLGIAGVYATGLLWGPQLDFAVMSMAHGLPYVVLMGLSLVKITENKQNNHFDSLKNHSKNQPDVTLKKTRTTSIWLVTMAILVTTLLLCGALDNAASEAITEPFGNFYSRITAVQAVLLGLVFTPLVLHYLWDALIWRQKDPDFQVVLAAGRRRSVGQVTSPRGTPPPG